MLGPVPSTETLHIGDHSLLPVSSHANGAEVEKAMKTYKMYQVMSVKRKNKLGKEGWRVVF